MNDKDSVSPKLHKKLLLYILIFLIGAGIVIFDIFTKREPLSYPLSGFIIGVLIGLITGRMYQIQWDDKTQQVITHIDLFGGIIFLIYMIFTLYKQDLIQLFTFGAAVTTTSIAVLAGVMLGRLLGIRKYVRKAISKHLKDLQEQK
jgi:hypothetical protein